MKEQSTYRLEGNSTTDFGREASHHPGGLKGRGALADRRSVVVSAGQYSRRALRRAANILRSDRERAEGFRGPLSCVSGSDQFDRRDEK